ncbi:calmodulin-binding protein 60 B-like isoform X1 [Rutidosis leptorrhynchoides]|uniref:calmodulin-binding protein 60 B-like isoform X1 n=1 Tax=Rutidosis leptorrhynchoides TaxID=125765 RepID=UPI003A99A847
MGDYYQNHHRYDWDSLASSKSINNLELKFTDEVPSSVFTKQNIARKATGEDESVSVILVDRTTQKMVTNGPLASSQVKMVLLRGNCGDVLTTQEFESNIVVEWQNKKKKNLLKGCVYVNLKNGRGSIGNVYIKHDRESLNNATFRLGAMIEGSCYGYDVKEAITNPFVVKDERNTPKRLRVLKLEDNVGRLKMIGKNGSIRKRLNANSIITVKDFLDLLSSNPVALKEMYRVEGKKWIETINHAKTCLMEHMSNAYGQNGSTSQQLNATASFDYNYENCYKPQPCDHDYLSNNMIEDVNFGTHEYEVMSDIEFMFAQEAILVENGKAKKRWIKLRAFWFSVRVFMCG